VRTHLVQEPQPRDDPVVQIDQFFFAELVDVDFYYCFFALMNILAVVRLRVRGQTRRDHSSPSKDRSEAPS
jgi:hypothetical protein